MNAIDRRCVGNERSWLRVPSCLIALGLILPIVDVWARAALGQVEAASKVDYNREVRPILARNCFACHGQDEAKRAKGLRLDRRDSAVKPLKNGEKAIVPKDPDSSELIARITEEDATMRMPPRKSGNQLTPAEIDILRRWIEQGAEYAPHWAFLAPQAKPIPSVLDRTWPRNGIDFWILDRLQKEELKPSPRASRQVLLRRLSLDLRGLPPTPEETERFNADQSSDAYERVVDRLLADPAYGERWARVWLDQARYADSAGYGSDPLRESIWRYRDWVVSAFNRNLPFDQFTLWQMAGDLLPGATLEEKIATAFHRNTMTNTEGGTDDEEFRVAAIKDRVDTTMQVFMGLTMGCAKCHSHKFDPITHEDYYSFYAIFNQTADNDQPDESPTIAAPTEEMTAKSRLFDAQIADLRKEQENALPCLAAAQARWEGTLRGADAAARKSVPKDVLGIVDVPESKRTKPQALALARYFGSIAPELKALRDKIVALEKARPVAPSVPVMAELPPAKRRVTRVLRKGNFLDPAEVVAPGVPASLHALPAGASPDRLGLARWLTDRRNPLTARVAVNRLWSQIFGTGLIETEEDFGTQGEPPSHPELLDWLAIFYQDSAWDTKGMLRLIVTSATYQQSSKVTPELRERDPRNRLLARAPRVRLEAEMVRDQAMASSGLLSRKLGGPSVFPPQPDGLWQAAFNGQRTWATSQGADRYRRGLYTFWRRTVPYPSMAAFDAPSREICAIKRVRTNTPLQAFVTMNDPVYVEAARALARRIVREGGTDVRGRVRFGLQLCLCRSPEPEQIEPLVALFSAEFQRFRNDSQAAANLSDAAPGSLPASTSSAELAAWTTVANVLLNLDGVLTKG
jgi:mono/diheme cytochrome c family protein